MALISLGTVAPVTAHTKCRVGLPFGGWTEGCPNHTHHQQRQQPFKTQYRGGSGHPQIRTNPGTKRSYYFTVTNIDSTETTYYRVNNGSKTFKLRPGYERRHKRSTRWNQLTVDADPYSGGFEPAYSKRFDAKYHDVDIRYNGRRLKITYP